MTVSLSDVAIISDGADPVAGSQKPLRGLGLQIVYLAMTLLRFRLAQAPERQARHCRLFKGEER